MLQHRSKKWEDIDAKDAVPNFPSLTENSLRDLTFGVYQLKQAPAYVDQHLTKGGLSVMVNQAANDLIHVRIQSRHISSKLYNIWIEYGTSVTGWYCECKVGARTIGCCAHIAAVLWYLGYARHQLYSPIQDRLTENLYDASAVSSGEVTDSD